MTKRYLKMAIALLMATVLTLNLPLGAYASEQPTYISEVKIGYGEAGKEALEAAGYTVRKDMNLNPGGEGGDVWLGYKTTFNSEEAITDMALMNQGTGYSFQGWCDELDSLQETITAMIDRFEAAIREYQVNLKAGSPYAVAARKILNIYREDDTGLPLGDFFDQYGARIYADGSDVKNPITKDQLVTLFMQANTEVLQVINQYLALGVAEYDADFQKKTFIDRLGEIECEEKPDSKIINTDRELVMEALIDTRTTVLLFEKRLQEIGLYESINSDYDALSEDEKAEINECISSYLDTLSDSGKANFMSELEFYEALGKIHYTENLAEGEFTLLDLLRLPLEYVDDETDCLSDELVDPLVKSMTPGQIGLLERVSFAALFNIVSTASSEETSEEYLKEVEAAYDLMKKKAGGNTISVYDGVDRELFYDRDTVALTSAALMDKAQSGGKDFGKTEEQGKQLNYYALILSGGVFIGGAVCLALFARDLSISRQAAEFLSFAPYSSEATTVGWFSETTLTYTVESEELFFTGVGESLGTPTLTTSVSTFRAFTFAIGVIALIAAAVLTILTFVDYWEDAEKPKREKFTYSQIPRVLMDLRYKGVGNTEKYYVAYYATENIIPASLEEKAYEQGSADSLSKYGDLNALYGYGPWLTLYTTKDANAGTPLLADLKISTSSTAEEGFEGVHMFSNTNAANLNQLQLNGAGAVYLFMSHSKASASEEQEPGDGTMSVFVKNPSVNAALALGLVSVGAMISGFAVAGYYKKRERAL